MQYSFRRRHSWKRLINIVIFVLVWYSEPLTSKFGLVNSRIKMIRLGWHLNPTHSMDVPIYALHPFFDQPWQQRYVFKVETMDSRVFKPFRYMTNFPRHGWNFPTKWKNLGRVGQFCFSDFVKKIVWHNYQTNVIIKFASYALLIVLEFI